MLHLGGRFVDVRGLSALLEAAGRARRQGSALAVVAPPAGLIRMTAALRLGRQLPSFHTVVQAARILEEEGFRRSG